MYQWRNRWTACLAVQKCSILTLIIFRTLQYPFLSLLQFSHARFISLPQFSHKAGHATAGCQGSFKNYQLSPRLNIELSCITLCPHRWNHLKA